MVFSSAGITCGQVGGTIKAIFYTNTEEDRHGYSQSLGILCKFYKPGCMGGRIRAHIHWNSKQRGGILWDRQKERIIKRWDVRQMWAVFWVLIFDKSINFLSSNFFPTEKTKGSTGSQLQKEYSEQESNEL